MQQYGARDPTLSERSSYCVGGLNFLGYKFRARGYFVTTVGRDEEMIRAYIRNQELADQQLDQLELKISAAPKSNQSS
jgi:putative transposase